MTNIIHIMTARAQGDVAQSAASWAAVPTPAVCCNFTATQVDFLAPGLQVIKFTRAQLPQTADVIPFVALPA